MATLENIASSRHLKRVYPVLKQNLESHGDAILKDMNCIVAYRVKDIDLKPVERTVVVDMRNEHGSNKGLIMLKESLDTMPQAYKKVIGSGKGYEAMTVKPDLTFEMSEKTFHALSEGEMSGFRGWLTGQVKIKGPFWMALKFDQNVVRRYNPKEAYSVKTKPRD